MDSLLLDLRYACRNLLRRPGFSALAASTLALGIGVNTIAFSAVNALLFHPFTFSGVERLGWVMLSAPGNPHGDVSWPQFEAIERSSTAFEAVGAEGRLPLAMNVEGRADQLFALLVSRNYFTSLDARAERGRTIGGADATAASLAAVVSHRFWRERMGGGSIAGRTLAINNRSVSVVGVMPDAFQGPGGLYAPDVWLPLEQARALDLPEKITGAGNTWLTLVARLAPGVTAARAQAELDALSARLPSLRGATADETGKLSLRFHPMVDGHPEVQGLARLVWVAMAIVAVVLLIACFNVASLLLARAAERQREIAIRTALGASRARVARQMLTEGLLLAAVGGTAALGAASWSARLLAAFSLPAPVPQRLHMELDARIAAFTVLAVLAAGILPSLFPALHATRRNIVASLRLDTVFGGRSSRARNVFVWAQIAGSTLFLSVGLLFVRSFLVATAFNPGFDMDRAAVMTIDPAQYGHVDNPRAVLDAILRRLASAPAIAAVSAADRVPFYVGYPKADIVSAPGETCEPGACRAVAAYGVLPRHFDALGIRLVAGRDFTAAEARTGTAVIVSESLARNRWPNASGVGQPLFLGAGRRPVEVVGIAADIKHHTMAESPAPVVYRPLTDADLASGFTVVARAAGDPRAALVAMRDAAHAAAPGVPIASAQTMRERMALPLWPYRTAAGFFLVCGGLALVLAMVGLFGVTYFAVRQRTREFGIRVAIGATPGAVLRQVLREGLGLTIPAAACGLAAAFVAGRLLARMLLGVSPADPVSFLGAAAIEVVVAFVACALPARRASSADPLVALRDG